MNTEAEQLWVAALAQLRTFVAPEDCELWLMPVRAVGLDAMVLTLEVADEFCEPWLGEAAGSARRNVFKIVRTDAGGFFGLTEWEGLPLAEFQGGFVDLLPPKPPTPDVIEVARVMLAMRGLNEQKLRGGTRRG